MKHIKFRILIIVWSSMILLFFAFAGILNIVLPSHFVSEAEDALEYEMDYQYYISNSNDEKMILRIIMKKIPMKNQLKNQLFKKSLKAVIKIRISPRIFTILM